MSTVQQRTTPLPALKFACRTCGRTGPGSYIGDSCGACREWADGQATSVLISRVERLLESRRQRHSGLRFAEVAA